MNINHSFLSTIFSFIKLLLFLSVTIAFPHLYSLLGRARLFFVVSHLFKSTRLVCDDLFTPYSSCLPMCWFFFSFIFWLLNFLSIDFCTQLISLASCNQHYACQTMNDSLISSLITIRLSVHDFFFVEVHSTDIG